MRRISQPLSNGSQRSHSAVRVLAQADALTGEKTDSLWLRRTELRSLNDVADYLESSGFNERPGMLNVLFVDCRCGLIRSQTVGKTAYAGSDETVRQILRSASDCHANGIILATHDLGGEIARSPSCRELTMKLYRKGEAIEVFLLNHFVLTADGWKRMFAFRPADRV